MSEYSRDSIWVCGRGGHRTGLSEFVTKVRWLMEVVRRKAELIP